MMHTIRWRVPDFHNLQTLFSCRYGGNQSFPHHKIANEPKRSCRRPNQQCATSFPTDRSIVSRSGSWNPADATKRPLCVQSMALPLNAQECPLAWFAHIPPCTVRYDGKMRCVLRGRGKTQRSARSQRGTRRCGWSHHDATSLSSYRIASAAAAVACIVGMQRPFTLASVWHHQSGGCHPNQGVLGSGASHFALAIPLVHLEVSDCRLDRSETWTTVRK